MNQSTIIAIAVFVAIVPVVGTGSAAVVETTASLEQLDDRESLVVSAVSSSPPTASFDYSPSTPNPDDEITLDAGGSSDNGTIVKYEWDTDGDGYYSDYDDPADGETATATFDSGGSYTVGLRVTDDSGNTDETTTTITVDNPAPEPSFDYSPSTPNPDDQITLDASDSSDLDGEIVSYEWDTDGDGYYSDFDDPSDGESATVSFDSGGTYTVGLRITDNGGKTTTTTKHITVDNPKPTADIQIRPIPPRPDTDITLDASDSSDLDGEIVSYEWDTDDDGRYGGYNDAPDGETTTVSFDTEGEYLVSVEVTDNGGATATDQFRITVKNTAPTAAFDYTPADLNPETEIRLNAGGSNDPDGEITSYEWDTDGDGEYGEYSDAGNGRTATVSFDSEGMYTVGLRVDDNGAKYDTITKEITVNNTAPAATFEYEPATPNPDDEIILDASGSRDLDGEIEFFEWDTDGDGEFSDYGDAEDGETATITYDTGGTYTVSLRVDDNGEKPDTVIREITVENPKPAANFSYSPTVPELDERVQFNASTATDPDGEIVSYTWIVDGERVGDTETFETTFDHRGAHDVTLIVTDNGGKEARKTVTIGVSKPPVAAIDYDPEAIGKNRTVTFDASDSYDPDGSIVEYRWQFEDGETRDGETVTRQLSNLGNHSVELTVVDNATLSVESNETVKVHPIPSASISIDRERPVEGAPVELRADSDRDTESYEWDFDTDGQIDDIGQTVTHRFESAGDHQVAVNVTSEAGITNRTTTTIGIDPEASFELTSNRGDIQPGESAVITFSIANNIRDRSVHARLQFDLPDTGVSISSVEGGSVSGRSSTNFVSVEGGEKQTIRIRMQFNEPGEYDIIGQSVYYYGNESNSQQRAVGPVNVSITENDQQETSASGPGFGIVGAVFGIVLFVLASKRRFSL